MTENLAANCVEQTGNRRRTVIRLIVIEGTNEWVEQTLRKSLLREAGQMYPTPNGFFGGHDEEGKEIRNQIRCSVVIDKPTSKLGIADDRYMIERAVQFQLELQEVRDKKGGEKKT